MTPTLVIATSVGDCGDGVASAAALAVAVAAQGDSGGDARSGVLLVEAAAGVQRRPTLLSSSSARDLETRLRAAGAEGAAARGRVCWLALAAEDGWRERLAGLLTAVDGARLVLAHLPPAEWRQALEDTDLHPAGALLRADTASARSLVALSVAELRARGLAVAVAARPLGLVGARRALAGLDPGGPASARVARLARRLAPPSHGAVRPRIGTAGERGQALPLVAGACFLVIFIGLLLAALGGAVTATARDQRAADLAALSAARSLRDDLPRALAPPRLPGGGPNPAHLVREEYLRRAEAAAVLAVRHNGVPARAVQVRFPDAHEAVPLRARVELDTEPRRWAEASASAPAEEPGATGPPVATGGGYSGRLAYRQGKPMRPDVAAAFDRLAAAAMRAGHRLVVTSAYRSDAEQARLFAQNPDPRWVARPGTSLHRCATELDLGPSTAYGWLAANARRFGFLRRYAWEPWHFGYVAGPAPCSAAGDRGGGDGSAPRGVPPFVPDAYRAPLLRAAARWNVSSGLLAAQLEAESGFEPRAVSPAGARGIAQFMPATAAAYGLRDPFDPAAAIDAQAHLMSDLMRRFGSVQLALAAYNAGPAPVAGCDCVPPYPETQAYVARIMALLDGTGELAVPLEVRLTR